VTDDAPTRSKLRPASGARLEREHERADGDVDEEDPLPAGVSREDPAEEHAGGGAAAAHCSPDPERLVPLGSLLESGGDDREGGRRHDRRAEPLHGARRDEDSGRAREAADQGGEREERQADEEHPLAAEDVAGTPAEQQEAAEGDCVGSDHPLQAGLREVQATPDRRQRDVDDRDVEHRHEERDADECERLPAARIGLCGVHRISSPVATPIVRRPSAGSGGDP
jgi:hypothetical protein